MGTCSLSVVLFGLSLLIITCQQHLAHQYDAFISAYVIQLLFSVFRPHSRLTIFHVYVVV
uniref:Uncharacterized protein n=1 Tax=Siphoviridae sp. ctRcp9 TaxID=2825504 RepID=A0A8S5PK72_9CAUD|nr:MAG TPA: hypothetical protein [Siphoviridae sp. ctRcp9]DAQ24618.1 MAG TPA: hypothetical protein [Caudoviricetes sp.]